MVMALTCDLMLILLLKVESCISQAQVLADLINTQHAVVAVQSDLSMLTTVEVEVSSFQQRERCQQRCSSQAAQFSSQLLFAVLSVLVFLELA